jgi:hypothetical protein
VLDKMHLDRSRIQSWVRQSGVPALGDHYRRSMRLTVSASPTLFINNTAYDKPIEAGRLAKVQCTALRQSSAPCDSLPECFDDRDCGKKGAIGRCTETGKCEFVPDARFTFTVLVADSTVQHPEKTVVATTEELFPNAVVEIVPLSSKKGRTLLKEYAPSGLPLYLFGAGVLQAHNFARVESGFAKVKDEFTFKSGITPQNYFPQRPQKAGEAILFIDPLFSGAAQGLKALMADSLLAKRVKLLPAVFADPREQSAGVEDRVRSEEALRWLVMDSLFRKQYPVYVAASLQEPGSSYWFKHLGEIGIAQETFLRQLPLCAALLQAHWRLLANLGIREPVTALLDNRQIVVVKSEADLAGVLEIVRRQ